MQPQSESMMHHAMQPNGKQTRPRFLSDANFILAWHDFKGIVQTLGTLNHQSIHLTNSKAKFLTLLNCQLQSLVRDSAMKVLVYVLWLFSLIVALNAMGETDSEYLVFHPISSALS